MFPPGLAVRAVSPADNEPVRALFIAGQKDLTNAGSPIDIRLEVKKYTDSCLMDDLARASAYYSKPGRRMWVLESQHHEVVAMAAVNNDASQPGMALFQRLVVSPEFRRKGVARLLVKRAEQWAGKQGFTAMRLYVSELQPAARSLYDSLSYTVREETRYGPVAIFVMEKRLEASALQS